MSKAQEWVDRLAIAIDRGETYPETHEFKTLDGNEIGLVWKDHAYLPTFETREASLPARDALRLAHWILDMFREDGEK